MSAFITGWRFAQGLPEWLAVVFKIYIRAPYWKGGFNTRRNLMRYRIYIIPLNMTLHSHQTMRYHPFNRIGPLTFMSTKAQDLAREILLMEEPFNMGFCQHIWTRLKFEDYLNWVLHGGQIPTLVPFKLKTQEQIEAEAKLWLKMNGRPTSDDDSSEEDDVQEEVVEEIPVLQEDVVKEDVVAEIGVVEEDVVEDVLEEIPVLQEDVVEEHVPAIPQCILPDISVPKRRRLSLNKKRKQLQPQEEPQPGPSHRPDIVLPSTYVRKVIVKKSKGSS